jgi:hypothetical protein
LCPTFCLAPSCNIGLVGYQCCRITHSAIYGIHNEPALATGIFGGIKGAKVTFGVDHAKDEKTPHSWKYDDGFEPEKAAELVWAEGAKREVDKPEEKESQHSCSGYPNGCGDMVGNIRVFVAKDAAKDVCHETGPRED